MVIKQQRLKRKRNVILLGHISMYIIKLDFKDFIFLQCELVWPQIIIVILIHFLEVS